MDAPEKCSACQRPTANDRVAQTGGGGENILLDRSGPHLVSISDKDPEKGSLAAERIYLLLLNLVGSILGPLAPSTEVTFLSRILKWNGGADEVAHCFD
jgi:hypothetical protein